MTCAEFRSKADSYLADELSVEANHEMMAHLEACAHCRTENASRRALRQTLRAAFTNTGDLQARDEFIAGVRDRLHAESNRPQGRVSFMRGWLALAASLLLVGAIGWMLASLAWRAQDPMDDLAVLSIEAAGNHRDCALLHTPDGAPISLDEAARLYDPAFERLLEVVSGSQPAKAKEIEVVGGHLCVFKGRRFGHIVIRSGDHVVSVSVVSAESLDGRSSSVAACPRSEGFAVACFAEAAHVVFVVSDLSDDRNLALARALAPALSGHLATA